MTPLQAFYAWVNRQSGEYHYADNCNCPMANFAREEHGLRFPNARTFTVDEADGPNGLYPADIIQEAAVDFGVALYHTIRQCATYEELSERMRTNEEFLL